ncbi:MULTISPECIES: hypothetical protein [Sphingobacterium]|jgi:hypothetical protein|uniref:hypothetical protein n=1 Tax=Sphingobacterium TaxID=28453 RepID=UPI00097E775B|nr:MULTISPECIES: hypothetical protein [Sphingobacterium]UPZ35283.1 hypothetical protein MUB18_14330 [Sphingobacterium sp. PCS056]UXD70839.1 hypothetical protein MUK51_05990 [Sphingobacterium faecium]WGQ14504.1 hypothetical protein QG727_21075 [Sphingobacterium faecium]SJN41812.1 hypothetical protein FM120_13330 [Sphingobacterium faecium PCAi_F2.5]
MFNIFKKRTILPEDYSNLIDEKSYEIFLKKCLLTLKYLGYKVISFNNGDIVYEKENSLEAHFYLDNLLRKYIQVNNEEQDIVIQTHFSKLKDQSKAYTYLYKDFDYAKQFLKILLKADDILPNNEDFVYQKSYPNLLTFLVFDFEDQFHYVEKSKVHLWEVDEIQLFEIAKNNLRKEEIEIKQYTYEDKYDVFVLLNGDFSSSYTLLIEQDLDFTIGQFGTLIALPTKGTAFLYPISEADILDVIVTIYPTVEQCFDEDPGNITLDFFWYFNGNYECFIKEKNDDGTMSISTPKKLAKLLNNN